jgi:hypothetical protein
MCVPLDPALGKLLLNWKLKSEFNKMDGWVFASPFQAGKNAVSSLGRPETQDQAGGRGSRLGAGLGGTPFGIRIGHTSTKPGHR